MKMKKILMISLIGLFFVSILGVFMPSKIENESVFASEQELGRVVDGGSSFFIEEGASVLVCDKSYNKNGLRYTIGMGKEMYEAVMAKDSGYTDIVFTLQEKRYFRA